MNRISIGVFTGLLVAFCLIPAPTVAQQDKTDGAPLNLNLFDNLAPDAFGSGGSDPVTWSATYRLNQGTRQGRLDVTAIVEPGWHIYSVTQPPGGPLPTKITIKSEVARIAGRFEPSVPAEVVFDDIFPDVAIEQHDGTIVWSAPIELAAAEGEPELPISVTALVCQTSCLPVNEDFVATFAGYIEPKATTAQYQPRTGHITIQGSVSPAKVAPGDKVTLQLTAQPEPPYHVYAYNVVDPEKVAKPTLIALTETAGWSATPPVASDKPIAQDLGLGDGPIYYHEGRVTWTIELNVPADTKPGDYRLAGMIGFQVCTDNSCDAPAGASFEVTVPVAAVSEPGSTALAFDSSSYSTVAKLAAAAVAPDSDPRAAPPSALSDTGPSGSADNSAGRASASGTIDLENLNPTTAEDSSMPLWTALMFAMLGGFILNFMPCVLPVIGLKVMSFVQQAGENRTRAFMLNVVYSLGLLSVFMVLATLAVVWNLGWGQQSQFSTFNITMTAVVFAMGLSFLGVWEIPIPGFVGTGKAVEYAEREGVSAAFIKGGITTVLAVPCSGPGLATALAWCTGKSPAMVYLVFAGMGLGMASPYLLIGLNPKLLSFLPKPGAWMETFKQIMGFFLLGTVVFIMSYMAIDLVLPTLAFLFGLWLACWWIGRTPLTAELPTKLKAWGQAAAIAVLVGLFSFGWFDGFMERKVAKDVDAEITRRRIEGVETAASRSAAEVNENELPWQPFSKQRLVEELSRGKTVMVDFTADWCLTCKTLEKVVLNTAEVKRAVEQNNIITLVADWTEENQEISELLSRLGSKQIPVLAIFPADNPQRPIVLRGGYTKGTLLEKLDQAGPSQQVAQTDDEDTAVAKK